LTYFTAGFVPDEDSEKPVYLQVVKGDVDDDPIPLS